jgi:large subunit ribosomal protein L10
VSLTLEQKKSVVAEVNEVAAGAQAAIAAEYTGLTVADMTALRAQARAQGVYVRVVKNSLAKRAIAGTEFECLSDSLTGPLLLVFSADDPGAGARIVREFKKTNDRLVPTAIAFAGEVRPPEDLKLLADMPTLDEARGQLLGLLQAPATQLVRTLAEPGGQFVRLLAAYRDKQQAA